MVVLQFPHKIIQQILQNNSFLFADSAVYFATARDFCKSFLKSKALVCFFPDPAARPAPKAETN
jgi:hypothetical protein